MKIYISIKHWEHCVIVNSQKWLLLSFYFLWYYWPVFINHFRSSLWHRVLVSTKTTLSNNLSFSLCNDIYFYYLQSSIIFTQYICAYTRIYILSLNWCCFDHCLVIAFAGINVYILDLDVDYWVVTWCCCWIIGLVLTSC